MTILVNTLILLIAAQHLGFLYLEMFLWTKPFGLKVFRMTPEQAAHSAAVAANQGLYNGFLSAGLIWSVTAPEELHRSLAIFFLSCVMIAALYGGYSVSKRILFIQGVPALLALTFLLLS